MEYNKDQMKIFWIFKANDQVFIHVMLNYWIW
jgi:hypothetical protein